MNSWEAWNGDDAFTVQFRSFVKASMDKLKTTLEKRTYSISGCLTPSYTTGSGVVTMMDDTDNNLGAFRK